MGIEDEIFKRSKLCLDKVLEFGFKKEDENYKYSEYILNDTFRVDILIDKEGKVKGNIFELELNEEYINHRIKSQTGEFVNRIRIEFERILEEIKKACTTQEYFIFSQANRIADLIKNKYHHTPQFLWEKSPGYGVFRNSSNEKWYGVIMNINKSKLDNEDGEVEIINLKLNEDQVQSLLTKNGFYPAYHMNKKNWISIILNDTLSDDVIMGYIEESYKFTEMRNEWLVPANPKYYDVIHCFDDTDTILWKQSNHINVGDMVYLYVGAPYSAVFCKCKVLEVNIPYEYKDKNLSMCKVMKIKLLKKYDKDEFSFSKLNEYGVKAIRGPRSITDELSKVFNI